MVPNPVRVSFSFENIRVEGPLDSKWGVLLRIVGDFEIEIEERSVFFEPEFPVVEFWLQLKRWLQRIDESGFASDFEYRSMESEHEPLVWFRKGPTGWTLGAFEPESREVHVLSLDELVAPSRDLIEGINRAVRDQCDVDLSALERQF